MNIQFLNSLEDIGWLITTHLKNRTAFFNSFIIIGNEDCPEEVRLYARKDPSHKSKPIATYKANEEGNLCLTSTE